MKSSLLVIIGTCWLAAHLSAGTFNVLHSFGTPEGDTGTTPNASVVAGPDGTLYGTASANGLYDYGVVYDVQTNGYGFALWNFANTGDGAYPYAELVLSGNTLYGTTAGLGGPGSYGTVFKVNTDGTGFATIYNFTNGTDGNGPRAGLVLNGNVLYGTATEGGATGLGTVFKVNTDGFRICGVEKFFRPGSGHGDERGWSFPHGNVVAEQRHLVRHHHQRRQ